MPILNKVAYEVVIQQFSNYDKIFTEIYVKIKDFMCEEELRNLRHKLLSKMVKIKGVITRR